MDVDKLAVGRFKLLGLPLHTGSQVNLILSILIL